MKDKSNLLTTYLNGNSLIETAKLNNCSVATVARFFNKNNIKCRKGRPEKTKYVKLSGRTKSIIIGGLLGDSYFIKDRNKKGIGITHSLKQKDYLLYKKELLGKLGCRIYFSKRFDKRTNRIYESVVLHTKSHPYIKDVFNKMFVKSKKDAPLEIINLLTPEAIAIWYCDDGCLYINRKNYVRDLSIATQQFPEETIFNIIEYFKMKYNIHFNKSKQNTIRINNKENIVRFIELIKQFVPKCMEYKIDYEKIGK